MKKNEQTRDVRDLVSLASDSDSLASFICKIEYLLIVLTHVKARIDSLFVKAVGNYVKQ